MKKEKNHHCQFAVKRKKERERKEGRVENDIAVEETGKRKSFFAISFLKAYLLALITGAYFTDERLGYRWSLLDKRIAIAKSFVFSNARQEAFAFRRLALNSA